MATGLRSLARFMSAPRGMRNNDLMREVGVPAWKLDTLRDSPTAGTTTGSDERSGRSRGPTPTSRAQASDPAYALERMVLDVVRARPGVTLEQQEGAGPRGATPVAVLL